ncbi:MAG: hypothetical protein ACD_79C01535G0009 [uncultured bacterium]|nr:MAG: hypothetical protein ACD_79C01535G0009 [uncultured bacterium]
MNDNIFLFSVDVESDFTDKNRDLTENVIKILEIFDIFSVRATFFIVAEIWKEKKGLLQEISKKHEIACHSMTHPDSKKEFDENIIREALQSKHILEDIVQNEIKGFRSPFLNSHHNDEKLMSFLYDCGFKYHSSCLKSIFLRKEYNIFDFNNEKFVEFYSDRLLILPFPLSSLYLRIFYPFNFLKRASNIIIHPHDYLSGIPTVSKWLTHPCGWWTSPLRFLFERNVDKGFILLKNYIGSLNKTFLSYNDVVDLLFKK